MGGGVGVGVGNEEFGSNPHRRKSDSQRQVRLGARIQGAMVIGGA